MFELIINILFIMHNRNYSGLATIQITSERKILKKSCVLQSNFLPSSKQG